MSSLLSNFCDRVCSRRSPLETYWPRQRNRPYFHYTHLTLNVTFFVIRAIFIVQYYVIYMSHRSILGISSAAFELYIGYQLYENNTNKNNNISVPFVFFASEECVWKIEILQPQSPTYCHYFWMRIGDITFGNSPSLAGWYIAIPRLWKLG